ncbi:hypothetical protein [Microbispora sp. NPDC049125]|uniref:hypothetical protein n=1 Tax=Microbispora sp. NPDC049125 TaxID=3154929 RepID=UPI003467BD9F
MTSQPPLYSVYLIRSDGKPVRVGPRGRPYGDCREHSALLRVAVAARQLDGFTDVSIQPDASRAFADVEELAGALAPGVMFTTLGAAGRAVVAHFSLATCPTGHLLDDRGGHTDRTYATLGAQMRRLGVLADMADRTYVLARMPRSGDVAGYCVAGRQEVAANNRAEPLAPRR